MRQLIGLLQIALLAAATAAISATAATSATAAQQPADPFDACARETGAAARLACFDQAVKRRDASRPAHEGEGRSSTAHDETAAADDENSKARDENSAGQAETSAAGDRTSPRVGHAPWAGGHDSAAVRAPDGAIVAHVARFEYHPDHRYIFDLDNGQVWEQVESQPGLFIHPHETVTITHGAFGSFFLQTSSRRLTRVHRLR